MMRATRQPLTLPLTLTMTRQQVPSCTRLTNSPVHENAASRHRNASARRTCARRRRASFTRCRSSSSCRWCGRLASRWTHRWRRAALRRTVPRFARSELLARSSAGVPVGEPSGCDVRGFMDGGGGRHQLQFPCLQNGGWDLSLQRRSWPWLIAAGPDKVQAISLDLSSPEARTAARMCGELTPAESTTGKARTNAYIKLSAALRPDAVQSPPGF